MLNQYFLSWSKGRLFYLSLLKLCPVLKEFVAVLNVLYKKNGAVSCAGSHKETTHAITYTKVVNEKQT